MERERQQNDSLVNGYRQHYEQRVQQVAALGVVPEIILFHPYDGGHWGFDRMNTLCGKAGTPSAAKCTGSDPSARSLAVQFLSLALHRLPSLDFHCLHTAFQFLSLTSHRLCSLGFHCLHTALPSTAFALPCLLTAFAPPLHRLQARPDRLPVV